MGSPSAAAKSVTERAIGESVPRKLKKGNDAVLYTLKLGDDSVSGLRPVPYIEIERGSDVVRGAVNPGGMVRLTLTAADGHVRSSVESTPDYYGALDARLTSGDDRAEYPRPGGTITAPIASDAVLRIPRMRLAGSHSTGEVNGQCMPNAPFELSVDGYFVYGRTRADGTFRRHIGSKNIGDGGGLYLTCSYATGDMLRIESESH